MADKINEKELEEVAGGGWAEYNATRMLIDTKIKLGIVACKNCGKKGPSALQLLPGRGSESDDGLILHCTLCDENACYTCEDFGVAPH